MSRVLPLALSVFADGPMNSFCLDAAPAMKLLGPGLGALPRDIITAESVLRGKVGFRLVSSLFLFFTRTSKLTFRLAPLPLLSQPFPDPYLMGAERLNVPISRCSYGASPLAPFLFVSLISSLFALLVAGLVVEDAPAGALAGLAAGATVLAVGTKSRSRSPYSFFFSSDYICSSSFFRELIPFPCSGAQVNPDYYVDDLTQSVLYLLNDSRQNLRSSRYIATDACVPFPLNPPPESPPNGRMGNSSLPSTQRTDDANSAYSCG